MYRPLCEIRDGMSSCYQEKCTIKLPWKIRLECTIWTGYKAEKWNIIPPFLYCTLTLHLYWYTRPQTRFTCCVVQGQEVTGEVRHTIGDSMTGLPREGWMIVKQESVVKCFHYLVVLILPLCILPHCLHGNVILHCYFFSYCFVVLICFYLIIRVVVLHRLAPN